MSNRKGGIINLKINGEIYLAKGNFTHNLGSPKRDTIIGADKVHGYTEKVQAPFIEGEITDTYDTDLRVFTTFDNATVTLEEANGKTFVLRNAWYCAEGNKQSEEGNVQFRAEGTDGEEIT